MTQATYNAIIETIEDLQVEGVEDDSSDVVYEIVRSRLVEQNIEISKQELCDILAEYK